MQIRLAEESDAEALYALAKRTFIETYEKDNSPENMAVYLAETFAPEKQLQEIRDPNRIIALGWSGDQPIGFFHLLKCPPHPSVKGPKPIELLRLYLDLGWQGRGAGAALLQEAMKTASGQGYQTMWLTVWERNFKAQKFYEKYGFATVGTSEFAVSTDIQTDLVMARVLGP